LKEYQLPVDLLFEVHDKVGGGLQWWPLREQTRGCPMPDTAASSHPLKDTAEECWWCLCENIFEKGQNSTHWLKKREE